VRTRRYRFYHVEGLGSAVDETHHDGVFGCAKLVSLVEQLADVAVMFEHAICLDAGPRHTFGMPFTAGFFQIKRKRRLSVGTLSFSRCGVSSDRGTACA
jgi:hypothetical protein